jgi:hypothetical protein
MRFNAFVIGIVGLVLLGGCGSNQALLKVNDLEKNQSVDLTLKTGEKVSGEIYKIDSQSLTVVDKNNKAWRAQKADIANAYGTIPIYDADGNIVSEKKIAQNMKSSNRLLFSVSGGLLCTGASFFASSMASRGGDESNKDAITYAGTAAGTLIGSYFFYKAGAKKDRRMAIQQITGSTKDPKIKAEKVKQDKIQSELDKQKQELEQQQKEIEKLQEELNKQP